MKNDGLGETHPGIPQKHLGAVLPQPILGLEAHLARESGLRSTNVISK
jgi:hypothetical protein